MDTLNVVIAPDSFKGSVSASEAAEAIAAGWRSVRGHDRVSAVPMADGGEGTIDAIQRAVPGALRSMARCVDAIGWPHEAPWLALPDGTVVIELAAICGIGQLRELAPMTATTAGIGQVIAAAAPHRLLIALGGSASTDGAAGALVSLGARLADADGHALRPEPAELRQLASVELTGLRPPPPAGVELLTDVTNPLLGPTGAAAVFGPQKGASQAQIAIMEAGLRRFAEVVPGGMAAAALPGSGAAGGTAFGFMAAWGATATPGALAIARLLGLPEMVSGADIVITGEGHVDATSLSGKVVGAVRGIASEVSAHARLAVVAGGSSVTGQHPAWSGIPILTLEQLAGSRAAAMRDPLPALVRAGAQLATAIPDTTGMAPVP